MVGILTDLLVFLAVGAVVTFLAGRSAKWVALLWSIGFLVGILALFHGFQWSTPTLAPSPAGSGVQPVPQFSDVESYPWISLGWLNINYTVGVDGIALVL